MRNLEAWALAAILAGVLSAKVSLMALAGGARTAGFVAAGVLCAAGVVLLVRWLREPGAGPGATAGETVASTREGEPR